MIGIYYIKNLINNKIYIGQSVDITKRFNTHRHRLRNNLHDNSHLQSAWNKYGESNFEFGLIKSTKERYLNRLEKLYISKYNCTNPICGYNHATGGNSNSGWVMSQETRDKISKANTGTTRPPFSEEHKQKLRLVHLGCTPWNKGRKMPQLSGKNHHMWGKHHSEETKRKISETKRGSKLSKETKDLLSQIRSKYTLWDFRKTKYDKRIMFQRNRIHDPCKCFKLMYNKKKIDIGGFIDFITPMLINDLIQEEVSV